MFGIVAGDSILAGAPLAEILTKSLMGVTVLGVVTLHEYGHVYAAQSHEIGVQSVTIWMLGGVANLKTEDASMAPTKELWIALAGPAVNAVLALATLPAFLLLDQNTFLFSIVRVFFIVNLALMVFNMIPAFPMDGGRVFRSLMARSYSKRTANAYAGVLGMVLGLVFVSFGIYQAAWLLSIIGGVIVVFNYGFLYQN